MPLNPRQQKVPNHSRLPLFFVILGLILVIGAIIVKYQEKPQISQNLPVNYYIELDVAKFSQESSQWLENNPNRQQLLNLWTQYLEKYLPKPPEGLFNDKISLIGLSSPIEGEQALAHLQDEVVIITSISNPQKTLNYLKSLGSTQFNQEEEFAILTLKNPVLNKNKYYYRLKKNQLSVSTESTLLDYKPKFPSENLLQTLSPDNKFLKIFAKPSNVSFLSSVLVNANDELRLSAELTPQKLLVNFENQDSNSKPINETWLNFHLSSHYIAFYNENIQNILNNHLNKIIPQEEIINLTFKNQSLLILQPKANFTLNPSDYHYALIAANPSHLTSKSQEINEIEQKIKQIFAKKFPTEQITRLPDNSTITELISKPEIFEFQIKNLSDISIKYLQKPNIEFAYAFFDDKILFSDSLALIEQSIVSKTNQNLKNSLVDCLETEKIPQDFIFFNPDANFQEKYGFRNAIITNQKACIY